MLSVNVFSAREDIGEVFIEFCIIAELKILKLFVR